MWHRLVQRGNEFFKKEWRIMAYQPVLYFFVFGASIRLWHNNTTPPNFDVIAHDFYNIWLGMGIAGPLLALLSWHLIKNKRGIWGFRGMWLRIAADICVLANILSYHIALNNLNAPLVYAEGRIYSRYIVGSTIIMCLIWIIRDLWTLTVTEILASRIHSGKDE